MNVIIKVVLNSNKQTNEQMIIHLTEIHLTTLCIIILMYDYVHMIVCILSVYHFKSTYYVNNEIHNTTDIYTYVALCIYMYIYK